MEVRFPKQLLRNAARIRPGDVGEGMYVFVRVLTGHAFLASIGLIALAVLIGGMMSFAALQDARGPLEGEKVDPLQFHEQAYQDILLKLEERQEEFQGAGTRSFKNVFSEPVPPEVEE